MSMLSSRVTGIVLFSLAPCLLGSRIGAFEGADGARDLEDFRSGGDAASTIEAFKFAASGGVPLAQWKLAQIYANGDGVPRDDLKAYDYFSQIVANYDEDNPDRRDLAIVSSAFVALGIYNLNGIANSKLRPDPQRALQMFQFAATTFADANAQYHLARMHLEGAGVDKDGREAIRWLFLAADKGHLQAQALLGLRPAGCTRLSRPSETAQLTSLGPIPAGRRHCLPSDHHSVNWIASCFEALEPEVQPLHFTRMDEAVPRMAGQSRDFSIS